MQQLYYFPIMPTVFRNCLVKYKKKNVKKICEDTFFYICYKNSQDSSTFFNLENSTLFGG